MYYLFMCGLLKKEQRPEEFCRKQIHPKEKKRKP